MADWFRFPWLPLGPARRADPRRAGRRAERRAARFLQRRGLRILERNWSTAGGEIDLIALEGEALVFVEVRLRHSSAWVDGLESVDHRKRARLRRAADAYLNASPHHCHRFARFDVMSLTSTNYRVTCDWIQDAFDNTTC